MKMLNDPKLKSFKIQKSHKFCFKSIQLDAKKSRDHSIISTFVNRGMIRDSLQVPGEQPYVRLLSGYHMEGHTNVNDADISFFVQLFFYL